MKMYGINFSLTCCAEPVLIVILFAIRSAFPVSSISEHMGLSMSQMIAFLFVNIYLFLVFKAESYCAAQTRSLYGPGCSLPHDPLAFALRVLRLQAAQSELAQPQPFKGWVSSRCMHGHFLYPLVNSSTILTSVKSDVFLLCPKSSVSLYLESWWLNRLLAHFQPGIASGPSFLPSAMRARGTCVSCSSFQL